MLYSTPSLFGSCSLRLAFCADLPVGGEAFAPLAHTLSAALQFAPNVGAICRERCGERLDLPAHLPAASRHIPFMCQFERLGNALRVPVRLSCWNQRGVQ